MRQKKNFIFEVPDNILSAFGFYTPVHLEKLSSTDFLDGRRISTLKKEHTYQKLYPKMSSFSLLTLRYPIAAGVSHSPCMEILKVIKNFIMERLLHFIKEDSLTTQGVLFLSQLVGPYADQLHISFPEPENDYASLIASCTLKSKKLLKIIVELPGLSSPPSFFGTAESKRSIKGGRYYFKNKPGQYAYIMDAGLFLSYVALHACLYAIRKEDLSPLVSELFSGYKYKYESKEQPVSQSFFTFMEKGIPIPLSLLFSTHKNSKGTEYYFFSPAWNEEEIINIFCKIHELYQDVSYEQEYRKRLHQSIATAYITKKNIPDYVLNAMNKSNFLKYFAFVEYDEEVDLSSVSKIEEEFTRLNKYYFSDLSFPDVTLRFRKLGKHKASGLYYPGLHTLCVDIRSPSSFIHEYFHMLDDQLGDLSLAVDFHKIVEEYRNAFLCGITNMDSAISKQLYGNSKYNLRYFFRRAEIFARCGEIYFTRILNVKTSLLITDLAYAYPETELLDSLINDYYKNLLEVIPTIASEKAAV